MSESFDFEHRIIGDPRAPMSMYTFTPPSSPKVDARYLRFVDALRRDSVFRERYQSLKQTLAGRDWSGMDAYAAAKTELVEEIIRHARQGDPPGA